MNITISTSVVLLALVSHQSQLLAHDSVLAHTHDGYLSLGLAGIAALSVLMIALSRRLKR